MIRNAALGTRHGQDTLDRAGIQDEEEPFEQDVIMLDDSSESGEEGELSSLDIDFVEVKQQHQVAEFRFQPGCSVILCYYKEPTKSEEDDHGEEISQKSPLIVSQVYHGTVTQVGFSFRDHQQHRHTALYKVEAQDYEVGSRSEKRIIVATEEDLVFKKGSPVWFLSKTGVEGGIVVGSEQLQLPVPLMLTEKQTKKDSSVVYSVQALSGTIHHGIESESVRCRPDAIMRHKAEQLLKAEYLLKAEQLLKKEQPVKKNSDACAKKEECAQSDMSIEGLPVSSFKDDAPPPTKDESDRLLSMAETEAMASDHECETVTESRTSDQGPENLGETEALAADDEFDTVAESRPSGQESENTDDIIATGADAAGIPPHSSLDNDDDTCTEADVGPESSGSACSTAEDVSSAAVPMESSLEQVIADRYKGPELRVTYSTDDGEPSSASLDKDATNDEDSLPVAETERKKANHVPALPLEERQCEEGAKELEGVDEEGPQGETRLENQVEEEETDDDEEEEWQEDDEMEKEREEGELSETENELEEGEIQPDEENATVAVMRGDVASLVNDNTDDLPSNKTKKSQFRQEVQDKIMAYFGEWLQSGKNDVLKQKAAEECGFKSTGSHGFFYAWRDLQQNKGWIAKSTSGKERRFHLTDAGRGNLPEGVVPEATRLRLHQAAVEPTQPCALSTLIPVHEEGSGDDVEGADSGSAAKEIQQRVSATTIVDNTSGADMNEGSFSSPTNPASASTTRTKVTGEMKQRHVLSFSASRSALDTAEFTGKKNNPQLLTDTNTTTDAERKEVHLAPKKNLLHRADSTVSNRRHSDVSSGLTADEPKTAGLHDTAGGVCGYGAHSNITFTGTPRIPKKRRPSQSPWSVLPSVSESPATSFKDAVSPASPQVFTSWAGEEPGQKRQRTDSTWDDFVVKYHEMAAAEEVERAPTTLLNTARSTPEGEKSLAPGNVTAQSSDSSPPSEESERTVRLPFHFGYQFLRDTILGEDGSGEKNMYNCSIEFVGKKVNKHDAAGYSQNRSDELLAVVLKGKDDSQLDHCVRAIENVLYRKVPPPLRGYLLYQMGKLNEYRYKWRGIPRTKNPFHWQPLDCPEQLQCVGFVRMGKKPNPERVKEFNDFLRNSFPSCRAVFCDGHDNFPRIPAHFIIASPDDNEVHKCRDLLGQKIKKRTYR